MSHPSEDDHFGDLRPILDDDLARFVGERDRHRSLTVVTDPREADVEGEAKRWLDRLRTDPATTGQCTAMQRAVERHADGSRDGQLRGALAVVRLDELGHAGAAGALDELWGVRARDRRDYERVITFARRVVVASPSPPDRRGCCCGSAQLPPTRAVVTGVLRKVLTAPDAEQPQLLAWALGKLRSWSASGQLDPEHAHTLAAQLRDAVHSRKADSR